MFRNLKNTTGNPPDNGAVEGHVSIVDREQFNIKGGNNIKSNQLLNDWTGKTPPERRNTGKRGMASLNA